GDIVHNDIVVNKITGAGIKKILRLGKGTDKTLIVRAHGASINTYNAARKRGYNIIDVTCPMVKEIHRIAGRAEKAGFKIAVIGDKDHEEVKGIVGQLKRRPVVISSLSDMPRVTLKRSSKIAVVVQSTQNADRVLPIVRALEKIAGEVIFFNTICRPTRQKQEEAKKLALKNDVVVVLGSCKSANTRRLYNIAKAKNGKTYWIESPASIKRSWFKKAKSVGILAGASTPDETIKETVSLLASF
ncbi:MAG: 4-hydroxy-3-methylbut-2-enyl diphosphate reductase, partial [Candidatus Omnitrophota bacterium]